MPLISPRMPVPQCLHSLYLLNPLIATMPVVLTVPYHLYNVCLYTVHAIKVQEEQLTYKQL